MTTISYFSLPFRSLALLAIVLFGSATVPLSAHRVSGEILSVNAAGFQLNIQIEGEDAVRSVFAGPGDIAIATPGRHFSGLLVQQGEAWRLENIFPTDPTAVATIDRLGEDLKRDTLARGRKSFRAVGDRLPPFALWDQNGDLFLSEQLKGQYVVINFVFTRCKMANMCPASTARMLELADAIKEKGWTDVHLVSVTLDPDYDTPGIWTTYAKGKGIDSHLHSLLGGPVETVEALKKQMGVLAEPDAEQIIRHTMSTALIDPAGKIIYRLPGSLWSPEVFIKQIQNHKAG